MEILKIKNTRLLKFFLTIISSFFLFFSFRQLFLFSEENLIFFLLYLIFQFIIFLFIFFKNYLLINLFILINLNLFLTPVFFNYTFDVPYRAPNKTIEVNWKKDLKKGFEIEKHFSTTDSRGNRVNKNILPTIKILDSRKQKGLISDKLQQEIKSNISNNLQTLLFLNKRGYAPFVICKKCGVTKTCNNCSSSLTLHEFAEKKKSYLLCSRWCRF